HIRNFSETVAAQIDAEVKRIVSECYDECKSTLTEHKDRLIAVAEYLFEKEKIEGPEFYAIMEGKDPKQAKDETANENEKTEELGVIIAPEMPEENETEE
ncbi:MAG TPA: cell division protein FtsH, partial [Oscillospiraceae bacterium]|nr:cell division protein FtsH [Oscillospiraceae bacterium]